MLSRNEKMKKEIKEKELKFKIVWFMHFQDIPPEEATCEDCEDYINRVCPGGKNPILCMMDKADKLKIKKEHIDGLVGITLEDQELLDKLG
jgi:hypothetical protein